MTLLLWKLKIEPAHKIVFLIIKLLKILENYAVKKS